MNDRFHGTTVLCVRWNGKVALGSDGQVSFGNTIVKHGARKIRRMFHDRVLSGFAEATADSMTLFERFDSKLEQYNGNLARAAVELAKDWRTDRMLRRLEALLVIADREHTFLLSGSGDVLEPDDGILAIGSGGPYALASARALVRHASGMNARAVVEESLRIASEICIYTNREIQIEELD